MSADNVLGWEIVLKISHLPSKVRFSAKCSFFGQSLSRGHYQPTYQPPEGVYLLNSRSFLANQKARNAIVGAENLLNCVIACGTRAYIASRIFADVAQGKWRPKFPKTFMLLAQISTPLCIFVISCYSLSEDSAEFRYVPLNIADH